MRKRIFALFAVVLVIAAAMLAGGCGGRTSMVAGAWQVVSTGDETGQNQQQTGMPFTIYYDVYPDGHVKYLFGGDEMAYGKYTMDRDTFTFASDDGKESYSGQFVINNQATDQSTGESYTQLTIYLDNVKKSVVMKKVMDYSGLVKYLKTLATTAPAPAATSAPAPAATPAPSAG